MPIRILLADDHAIVRDGLRAVLAEPVKRVPELDDTAAMRLNVFALIVRPDFSGPDGLCWMRGEAEEHRHDDETQGFCR